jgi:oligogalacturonide lyase
VSKQENGVGRSFTVERREIRDPETGRTSWKICPDDGMCRNMYMYINSFTEDERYALYMSTMTGETQFYRYEIETGETVQISDGDSVAWGGSINPVSQEFFYQDADAIRAVHMHSLERREVYRKTGHPILETAGGFMTFSPSGQRFAVAYSDAEDRGGVARGFCDGSGVESVYVRPSEQNQHVLYANADEDTISFAVTPDHQNDMSLDDATRARAWLVDAKTGEAEPFLTMPKGFRATHEYWGPTGERLYYHKKTQPGWTPAYIGVMDRKTREQKDLFRSDTIKLGHSYVNRDETKIVSDSQEPGRNELILIDIALGTHEVVCWPNSSIKGRDPDNPNNQDAHVHPTFSPTGRYVLYSSDASGVAQVYILPLW